MTSLRTSAWEATLDLDSRKSEVLNISVVMVLAASKPEVLGQVFEVYVRQATPLWLPNKPLLQKSSSSPELYGLTRICLLP